VCWSLKCLCSANEEDKFRCLSLAACVQVTRGSGREDEALSVQLMVRRALDREVIDRYSMRLYATDGDARGASNSGYVDVLINVVDENDNRPVFEGEARYEVTVPENVPLRTAEYVPLRSTETVLENVPLRTTILAVLEGEGRYEVTVPENVPPHTTILRVKAVDDDDGLNGQVS